MPQSSTLQRLRAFADFEGSPVLDDIVTELEIAEIERWLLGCDHDVAPKSDGTFVCRSCGQSPEVVGWCDDCGYNRNYPGVRVYRDPYVVGCEVVNRLDLDGPRAAAMLGSLLPDRMLDGVFVYDDRDPK